MMKKIIALFLTLFLVVGGVQIEPQTTMADETKNYTLGTEVSGTATATYLYGMLMTSSTDSYTFTLNSAMDLVVTFTAESESLKVIMDGPDIYKSNTVSGGTRTTLKYYAKAGSYTFKVTGGSGNYKFVINNSGDYNLKFDKSSGSIDGAVKKTVGFTYSCSYDFAKENISLKNSKSKVVDATYSLNTDGTGTVTLDPKKIGKSKITISLKGGKTAKYTAIVKSMAVFIAKGQSMKLTKPTGIKNPKWKSKKKSIVTVKGGKIKAKKGGRTTVTAKKGKTTFEYRVVVTDYIKLGKQAYREIKENVRNPEKFKVYTVYAGFDKNIIKGVSIPVIFIDFGYTNSYGAMERGKMISYYDDVHELKAFAVNSYADVMKKKKVAVSKIKS